MITILSGGTGTPKLIQGILKIYDPEKLTIIVNTLENTYVSGVYVAADIDTVMYTLAGWINEKTWYGIESDTFITHETLKKINFPETLKIGDKDRAIKIQKTLLMAKYPLSQAVDIQRRNLGIKSSIIPMSDERSNVEIITDVGVLDFHQFLIEKQSRPQVLDVVYDKVKPAPKVIYAIKNADRVVIGPSNPITSIEPIISVHGVRKALKKASVTAVSPIIGNKPVSGPAAKFMQAKGYEVSSLGVASIYQDIVDKFIIDHKDSQLQHKIEKLISNVMITNTKMQNIQDKVNLARNVLGEIL